MRPNRPKVIFFDAVGTLFAVQRSVGELYAELSAEFGIEVSPIVLDQSFRQIFGSMPSPTFALNATDVEIQQLEKQWWYDLVYEVFSQCLSQKLIQGFDDFFERVFEYFGTDSAWVLYPEVISTLETLSMQGIELGVISNFDSRLISVLEALNLRHYFQSITMSTQEGFAKPDPQIFWQALNKHDCAPYAAMHVGDQRIDDLQGALLAGLVGVWLDRGRTINELVKVDSTWVISSLDQILEY